MFNKPVTMPRWRYLLMMLLAFAAGGVVIHNLSPFNLAAMVVIVALIDYGSERLSKHS